jgi:hypothetical protein
MFFTVYGPGGALGNTPSVEIETTGQGGSLQLKDGDLAKNRDFIAPSSGTRYGSMLSVTGNRQLTVNSTSKRGSEISKDGEGKVVWHAPEQGLRQN